MTFIQAAKEEWRQRVFRSQYGNELYPLIPFTDEQKESFLEQKLISQSKLFAAKVEELKQIQCAEGHSRSTRYCDPCVSMTDRNCALSAVLASLKEV
jgi:hypothetical protein